MKSFFRSGPVVKPDWLAAAIPNIQNSLHLYAVKVIPSPIEAFMLITPMKHALRGIYGKDNRGVAWALFKEAWLEYCYTSWYSFRYKIGWLSPDMKEAELHSDMEEE